MELTESHYRRVADCLPLPRGNVSLARLRLRNAPLHVVEQGCKWRGLPEQHGNWHTIYTRVSRWRKGRVLGQVSRASRKARS